MGPCHDAAVSHDEDEDEGDRRDGERRGRSRRRFRSDPGRRDPGARPRRSTDRGRGGLSKLLVVGLVAAVLALAWRAVVVAPRRGARVTSEEAERAAGPILERLVLPLQAVPGFAPPGEGDPALGAALTTAQREQLLALSERLALASDAAPREVDPYLWQGPVLFALGDERGARIAWQQVVALGEAEIAAPARVGIAALQIRAGLRSAGEQDRAFALESALRTLEPVDRTSLVWPHRLVEEAVARLALGDEDTVDAVLAELGNLGGEVASAALPLLESRRSGERPLSATLEAHVDQAPAQE